MMKENVCYTFILAILHLVGLITIADYAFACTLTPRIDVMHKPLFMLEAYPAAGYNYSIGEAFMLFHKVYTDVAASLAVVNNIPYYVEAEFTPLADGYGEYTLLIYYYDHEKEYTERLDIGDSINVRISMDAFNLIDLSPDCSTSPAAEHEFFTLVEFLNAYTMNIIKRFDANIESVSVQRISTDAAYVYYLAEVAKVNGDPLLAYPYIPFLITVTHDSGKEGEIVYLYNPADRRDIYAPRPIPFSLLILYYVLANLQYLFAITIVGCIIMLLFWLYRGKR